MNKLCLIFTLLITSNLSFASTSPDSVDGNPVAGDIYFLPGTTPSVNEINFWAGYAFDSWRLWGKTPDATLSQLGLRYNRKFLRVGKHVLEYAVEADLYAHYDYPAYEPYTGRIRLTGFGISPVGLQFNFNADATVQPFLKTAGGFMLLNGPFPDERGTKFNFTYGAGGGLEVMVSGNSSFTLGYRYYHLSNWFRGKVNPGVDSSFFYVGITVF